MGTGTLSVPMPFVLFHNALALSHGVAFNPDDIGVIDNPVTDGISQSRVMLLLAEKEPDFDYELFFKSYASLWRCKTDYINEMRSTEDEHPLNFLRTNVTLQQFEKFYETFDIGPGDGMYLAPEDRIPVW